MISRKHLKCEHTRHAHGRWVCVPGLTRRLWDAEAGAPERAPTRGDRDADDNDGLKISHNISINAPIYFLTALSLTTSPA